MQDAVIHTDAGAPTHIARSVTIGHRALLHSCTVGEETLIGNGAMVLDARAHRPPLRDRRRALRSPDHEIPPRMVRS